jgi:CheY-like chemotaxis protein
VRTNNRWVIGIAGVFFQIALSAVYAWSVFRVPLTKQFGWSISQVTLTFTISIFVLGFAAFFGGLWLNRKGPRIVALTGGVFYGLGVFLASFTHSLAWLYFSYGLIGGIGLGLSYIVSVAVLVKWFPDKRGLITGIAVGGFGAGALITAPVATRLIQSVGVLSTFAYLGIAYLIVTIIAGMFMQNPPEGWQLEGWKPSALQTSQRAGHDYILGEALKTWQWWALWMLLFLNTCAGIAVISQEAPIFQELTKVSAVVAGGMVGIASLGNAVSALKRELASLGYQVAATASTADEALNAVELHKPDLVLMDITLAGTVNGIVAAVAIRGNFHVPVVFLTAHADDGTMERAVAAGAFGYVLKPFSGPGLKAAIETALHKYQTEIESRRASTRAA